MQTQKIQLPIKNFPAQEQIFKSSTRFKIVSKGRRFGLTKGAVNNFIQEALEGKFKQGLWGDTVNANIERYVERYFIPSLNKLPKGSWNWRKQPKILEILDSYIDFRSADTPENWEGFGYDKVFLNEAGIILNDAYLWENAIKPMLWEFAPRTVVGGTPKGMNTFHELAMRGQDPNQKAYEFFHFTSFDNPFLDHKALQEDMLSMPERVIKQEIYAEFLEDTGVVFRGTKAIAIATPQKPKTGHLYVMGLDLAKVQDYTVIAIYDRSNNCQVYQDRFRTLEWPFQKKKIISIAQHYNHALIVPDATGVGDPIVDDLLRAGMAVEPLKLTNQSKKEIIEKLSIYIEQAKINMLNIPETLAEFNSFTYDITNSGRISYNAPAGFHDDIVIAHALAVWQLTPLYPSIQTQPVSLIRERYQQSTKGNSEYEFDFNYDNPQEFD